MLLPLLFVLMAQSVQDPVRTVEFTQRVNAVRSDAMEQMVQIHQKQEKKRFEKSFNEMIAALEDFTHDYNQSRGHVWPKKKADRLEKAIRQLQSCEAWKQYAHPDE